MRILGLDISSKTTGYGIVDLVDDKITLVKSGYFKPAQTGTVFEKLNGLRSDVEDILDEYKPEHIGIEDIISFMKGHSTAKTIITLTTFNRMLGLAAFDYLKQFNRQPQLFNVRSIRQGLKTQKYPKPAKEEMPMVLEEHLNITFPYILTSRGKNKGKIMIESYDMADGMAVATFYAVKVKKGLIKI